MGKEPLGQEAVGVRVVAAKAGQLGSVPRMSQWTNEWDDGARVWLGLEDLTGVGS